MASSSTSAAFLSPFLMVLLLLLLLPGEVKASLECRPPGPVVPRPRDISKQPLFTNATDDLVRALEAALAGEINAGWPVENTSFSIGVITWDQRDAAVPVWEWHHLAKTAEGTGTKELTRDSQYLIGSVSKVLSDYILLRSGVDLDMSIVEFLPELGDEKALIEWRHVTLRQLASQLAGIPPNYGFSEYYYLKDYFEALGFPHLDDGAYAPCGIIGLNGGCTREQFLEGMLESYPVANPAERPVYSNIAFTLLMYAVEEQTGMSYKELLETYVSKPLGLQNTVVSPGDDEKAVIPPGDSSWGADYGDNAPGGGLVSSLSDLSIFLHGILNRTLFDGSETAIREWLKPASSTGSLNTLVGTPWEIYRTEDITPDHLHVVDIYAKGGAAYGYQAQVAVIDELGVASVLLTAGSVLAAGHIYDAVLATIVPALDRSAREQVVERGYTGMFVDHSDNSSGASSLETEEGGGGFAFKVTIVQDEDSLVLQGIERNGSDIMAAFLEVWSVTVGAFFASTPVKPRIFPIDVRNEDLDLVSALEMSDGEKKKVIREDWRIDWELASSSDTDLPGKGLSAKNCLTWTLTDWMYYGSEPLDRIVFVLDAESGVVVGLEIPYLRSGVLQPAK
ncbi:beta-lactamase/transpeptidase-like protein [Xylariaceae sp. AK1471]|nr:beta-lactamase/transpeptidase-like protein [Xylariaceae sp. AK1471]